MGRARVVAPPPTDFIPVPLEKSHDELIAETYVEPLLEKHIQISNTVETFDHIIVEAKEETKPDKKQKKKEKEILASRELGIIKRKSAELENKVASLTEQLETERRLSDELMSSTTAEHKGAITMLQSMLTKIQDERDGLAKEQENITLRNRNAGIEESRLRAKQAEDHKKDVDALKAQLAELNQKLVTAREDALISFREEQALKRIKEEIVSNVTEIHQIKSSPTWWSNLVSFFKRKRIELTMKTITNMDAAIVVRAKFAIPKMLDDIEKIHDQLSILEEMISRLPESKNLSKNRNLDR
jgi:hypothetical protein